MSANELEDLMSQLQVNQVESQMINDNIFLGALPKAINDAGYRWAYTNEQTLYRDGMPRKYPLKDDYSPKIYTDTIPYIPKLEKGLVDLDGKPMVVFTVPTLANGRINLPALDSKQWMSIFMNEYYKRQRMSHMYHSVKNKYDMLLSGQGGAVRQSSYATSATGGGTGGRTGGAKKVLPSMVANGSVKPRQAQATTSSGTTKAKSDSKDKAMFRGEGKNRW
jgi:hypothetical protein